MYILGVDAGATKTHAAIASSDGKIVGRASAGPANFHTQTVHDFKMSVGEAIQGAALGANIEPPVFDAACFGGAGLDNPLLIKDAKELLLDVIKVQDPAKLLVVNDTQLVRPACSAQEYGVSLIAGTGSNCYGVNKKGDEAYAGGLDYLLADEGSAYWIGLKVLQAATRSADGRGPKSLLEELLLAELKVHDMREVVDVVYREGFGKPDVARVGMIIDKAYTRDDEVATAILKSAADELALAVNTVMKKLHMEDEDFDIVAVGGVFNSPYPFKEKITEQLINRNVEFIICDKAPVEGALALARSILRAHTD